MPVKSATYLDSNASAPIALRVRAELAALLESEAFSSNPSSRHTHGRESRRRIEEARDVVAASWGSTRPDQVTFVSSGTEANQTVIRSAIAGASSPVWITTLGEHSSVHAMIAALRAEGVTVETVPVDREGRADLTALSEALERNRGRVSLVSAIWVGNETGVVADVSRISTLCREAGAPLHLDGAQAWGKIPIRIPETGAAFVTFSGHKIGALAGIGAVYSAKPFSSPLVFGSQEKGARGGTENLIGVVSLGLAATDLDPLTFSSRVRPLRDRLEELVRDRCAPVVIQAAGTERVANTALLTFPGCRPDALVSALDVAGFSVSVGSACQSGSPEASRVLLAMGVSEADARASIRVSLSSANTREEIESLAHALETLVAKLRSPAVTGSRYASALNDVSVHP